MVLCSVVSYIYDVIKNFVKTQWGGGGGGGGDI